MTKTFICILGVLFFVNTTAYCKKDILEILKNAEHGDIEAQYELGRIYNSGRKKDTEEAVKWYTKAAENGHMNAQCTLGRLYFQGRDITKDYVQSAKWYKKAAEQGDTDAQYHTGEHYEWGNGVKQDNKEAFKWYNKAAENGYIDGEYKLGQMYYEGKGAEQDYAEAVKWCRKAAEKGHEKAQYQLAEQYYQGKGPEQDYEQAFNWYSRATNVRLEIFPIHDVGLFYYVSEGDTDAQCKLAEMYLKGQGVQKDHSQAFKCYNQAAERGNKEAQFHLANMYFQGEATQADHAEAYKWISLSAKQDYEKASQSKESIEKEISPEDILRGEELADKFKIKKNSFGNYMFDISPGEYKTRTCREMSEEDIANTPKFTMPTIPKIDIPKYEIPTIPKIDIPRFDPPPMPAIPKFEPIKLPPMPKFEPPTIPKIDIPSYDPSQFKIPSNPRSKRRSRRQGQRTSGSSAEGVYSKFTGSGGSYKDPIHGFFEAEPPQGYKVVEQNERTTTTLDSGTIVPCSRIRFQSDKARIAVVTHKSFRGTIEEDFNTVLKKYQSAGAKIENNRFVTIDGVKGGEVVLSVAGYKLMHVKYKKHGLDHAITISCSSEDFLKLRKQFSAFLRSYRSMKSK